MTYSSSPYAGAWPASGDLLPSGRYLIAHAGDTGSGSAPGAAGGRLTAIIWHYMAQRAGVDRRPPRGSATRRVGSISAPSPRGMGIRRARDAVAAVSCLPLPVYRLTADAAAATSARRMAAVPGLMAALLWPNGSPAPARRCLRAMPRLLLRGALALGMMVFDAVIISRMRWRLTGRRGRVIVERNVYQHRLHAHHAGRQRLTPPTPRRCRRPQLDSGRGEAAGRGADGEPRPRLMGLNQFQSATTQAHPQRSAARVSRPPGSTCTQRPIPSCTSSARSAGASAEVSAVEIDCRRRGTRCRRGRADIPRRRGDRRTGIGFEPPRR